MITFPFSGLGGGIVYFMFLKLKNPKNFCLVFCAYITNSSLNSLPNEYISSLYIQIPQIIYQFYIFFFW